jgi:amino acid transporter
MPDVTADRGGQHGGGGSISLVGAAAIGVGGMMGAGLYTLVGLAATTAGVWLPLAFVVAGAVASFSVYSYAKLGAT